MLNNVTGTERILWITLLTLSILESVLTVAEVEVPRTIKIIGLSIMSVSLVGIVILWGVKKFKN